MKFYYLPHHLGFISLSKNHLTIYNETQEAKPYMLVDNSNAINHWLRYYQPIEEIQTSITAYHINENKTFQENGLIVENWIIK